MYAFSGRESYAQKALKGGTTLEHDQHVINLCTHVVNVRIRYGMLGRGRSHLGA
jgi:hypothetical protein